MQKSRLFYRLDEKMMKIKLLVASSDNGYAEDLTKTLSEKHSDIFETSVCTTRKLFYDTLERQKFDTALIEPHFISEKPDLTSILLPLLLWSDCEPLTDSDSATPLKKISKYQRISSLTSEVIEHYSGVSPVGCEISTKKTQIAAFWSPAGGVGTTTASLAYAASQVSDSRQVLYLNLESFASTPVYFAEGGKSISAAFEMLENNNGNVSMLIRGLRKHDVSSGVAYFLHPDNYDDMNILSAEDAAEMISACCAIADQLVIDISCICNRRTWQIFALADKIFIVTDRSKTAQQKLSQFTSQHNVFQRIKTKTTFIANKDATIRGFPAESIISLPFITTADESEVYKPLSEGFHGETA